ncbi:MAG: class I SAM-dependent methyltransferase, partial [Oscillospiraceae bacterium]|nr:class I SAM-dependent methyltransferase [Oscillospiraceae bacterium]
MSKYLKRLKNRVAAHMTAHFYSPVPSISGIKKDEGRIFKQEEELAGIDLNREEQLELFYTLTKHIEKHPFPETKKDGIRYYFQNGWFGRMDSIVLYAMICEYKPQRIIEVGSGFSSCVMLDVNQLNFYDQIRLIFIEPYPKRLLTNVTPTDNYTLHQTRVQDTEPSIYGELEKGDILFIDSSHVSKIGSDVNFLCFDVIPRLKSGVIIHFHDIAWPFEYSKTTAYEGLAWNEAYMLRALLTGSTMLKIK